MLQKGGELGGTKEGREGGGEGKGMQQPPPPGWKSCGNRLVIRSGELGTGQPNAAERGKEEGAGGEGLQRGDRQAREESRRDAAGRREERTECRREATE